LKNEEEGWRLPPDLVVIDGGKGQLGVAAEVLQELGLLERIPLVGLAKREEEYLRRHARSALAASGAAPGAPPGAADPRRGPPLWDRLPPHPAQPGADPFAARRHPGVGPKRRKAILAHFDGDLERVRQATVEELMAVPGLNRQVAERVKESL
jgi:excinuclease ABC subunit C